MRQVITIILQYVLRIKKNDLGRIQSGKMELSGIGEIADLFWKEIPLHFKNVVLDEYIIMQNHIHGIIQLDSKNSDGRNEYSQIEIGQNLSTFQHVQKNSIPSIIRSYKASVTRWCNQNEFESFQWQRNYYEHIIRTETDYFHIRQYIQANPENWREDEYNK